MAQENVEIVRNVYDGINRFGPASLLALPDGARRKAFEQLFDPDFEIRQNSDLVLDTKGTFRGYEGFLASTRELVEAFSDIRFELGKEVESGDTVVFEVRALVTGRGSGASAERTMAHLWELKDGLPRRWVVYLTLGEALEAAGLSE